MDDAIQREADDSPAFSPPLPVMVGDIEYLYRKDPNYDRELDEIDWENLLFDEPDEFDPEIHAYDSRNYATDEEADAALKKLFDECLEEACRGTVHERKHDGSRQARLCGDCLRFIAEQPRGDPAARERDILREVDKICEVPEHRRVEVTRKGSGIELRRRSAAQFVIVYTFFKPRKRLPDGLVSIRAIRHRRVRDVFLGVKDSAPPPPPYGSAAGGGIT